MKKLLSCLTVLAMAAALMAPVASAAGYMDIPAGSSLAGEVQKAVDYGLMNGYSATRFGYADSMTRAQFTAVLVRMMGWELITPDTPTYDDVPASHTWYSVIETAAAHGVKDWSSNGKQFRPGEAITRAEMSKLLVQALGLEEAALQMNDSTIPLSDAYLILHGSTPFLDLPMGEEGYITVAYSIGMTNGTSATTFSPNATATRAQAAAMLVRIYEKIHQDTDFVHGFYAISSYSQLGLTENMDAVSAGWSRMTWDGSTALLSTTSAGGNEYAVPNGYAEVTEALEGRMNLGVFMDGGELKSMLASADGRAQAVEQIINELTVTYKTIGKNPYSGVTIDFEGLQREQKDPFTDFLLRLNAELEKLDKSLYVCVAPVTETEYYNGGLYDRYDYDVIGSFVDKFILMAYDYDARDMSQFVGTEYYKTAATAPVDQVYLSLKFLTNQVDPSKVALGFSARNAAWKTDKNGKLLSGTPVYPSNDTVAKRLAQPDTVLGWSDTYQQSYAIYTTEDGSRYFLWYQDGRSVQQELQTAKLLGVTGISLWRLGTIPQSNGWNWNNLLA